MESFAVDVANTAFSINDIFRTTSRLGLGGSGVDCETCLDHASSMT
jgi:hypothetical protein